MKTYTFNGTQFSDLNSLAEEYINNFDLGVEDIYKNPKKLVSFVKSQVKNKERVQNVVETLALSKYKNNALTFIIYEFLENKKVIINGKDLSSFDDFLILLKNHPEKENNVLFAFLEDHGITRCYERLEPANPAFKDAYFIEKYYNHDFTYKYLTTFKDFEAPEQLEKKFQSIAIANEECFRRASKIASDESFMIYIAHKFGFKAAIQMKLARNPLFIALSLFKNDFDENMLKKIVADSFFWWLYDNFFRYEFNKKAKQVKDKLNDIKIDYNKAIDLVTKHKADKVSLDLYLEISERLYDAYLDFIHYFNLGLITIDPKEDKEAFTPDKPYCKTYITADFMKGKIIKLYTKSEIAPKINPLTGEAIVEEVEATKVDMDDVTDDEPVEYNTDISSDEKLYKAKRLMDAIQRLSTSAIVLSLIALGFIIFTFFVKPFVAENPTLTPLVNLDSYVTPYSFIGIAACVLTFAFAIANIITSSKKEQAIMDYRYLLKCEKMETLTLAQEEKAYNIRNNMDEIMHQIGKSHRIISGLLPFAYAGVSSICGMLLGQLIRGFMNKEVITSPVYVLVSLTAPMAIGLLLGLAFKKKGILLNILLLILGLGAGIAMALVL